MHQDVVHLTQLREEWLRLAKSLVVFYLSTNILDCIWMTKEKQLILNLNQNILNMRITF